MQKKLMSLALAAFTILGLNACDSGNNNTSASNTSTTSDSSSVSTSISSTVSSTPVELNEYYKVPNWSSSSLKINTSLDMLDVNVGKQFVVGCDYELGFSFYDYPNEDGKEIVEISNEKVIKLEKNEATNTYKATALHEGDTFIRITDSYGLIRYCEKISVRNPIDYKDMEEYLVYEADYWIPNYSPWGDTYYLTFYENGQFSLTGTLSNQAFGYNGTYKFESISEDNKEYKYVFTDNESSINGFNGFNISKTGDWMYLQDSAGTAAVMVPKKNK